MFYASEKRPFPNLIENGRFLASVSCDDGSVTALGFYRLRQAGILPTSIKGMANSAAQDESDVVDVVVGCASEGSANGAFFAITGK